MKKKVTVYWLKRSYRKSTRDNICDHFGVESKMSINGETIFEVDDKQMEELKSLEEKSYLQLRFKNYENK